MEPFVQQLPETLSLLPVSLKDRRIIAGMSSRLGGVSEAPFASLNLGFHVKDRIEAVKENRRRLGETLGIDPSRWVCAEQVHGTELARITGKDAGRGALEPSDALSGIDGFYTSEPDLLLVTGHADCVPLYFYSKTAPAVGLAHAGWRGTVGEIGARMVERLEEDFGIKPNELSVIIGPSIGVCCYEVDDQVADHVGAISNIAYDKVMVKKENGRYMLNLQELNAQILEKQGVPRDRIAITTLCTSCRTDLFYSHRKEQGRTGRMLSYIGMVSGD
ncbi:peptidoglycan editing factor PgeF [Camelliibacillus cellulosilyticus]|uniref:Purine nucleoside phosphorylase n=2 Tax=Camelliibacillus cellulosilyticus TaxID=2174486 RepID=A0ABV9GH04_9BACL